MKILSVTGSRSDYSLMSKIFRLLSEDPEVEHHLFVTGMLLEGDHEDMLARIRSDAYGIIHEAKTFGRKHDSAAMSKALGSTILAITDVIKSIEPKYVVLQGDRGEMLAAAIAAAHLNTAIAHLSGGDQSGSIDDSIRNALSKFAHVHFTTCKQSSSKLRLMGESSARIFTVGEPGVDVLLEAKLLSRREFESLFSLSPDEPFLLACQHPVTTEVNQTSKQFAETVAALRQSGIKTIFTYPNNDAGAEFIISALEKLKIEPWAIVEKNLGSTKFLSALKFASALVGNSSSGIWEAPSFRTPVVNIGSRQHLRLRAENVIDADPDRESILRAIQICLHDHEFRKRIATVVNPYGDGRSSERVISKLKTLSHRPRFLEKWFDATIET